MKQTTPARGFIYWARMDKRRPVLVLSPDYRNERANDVIVIPCSSVIREAPTHVALRAGEAGVRARAVLKCEQVTTLPIEALSARPLGGRLSAERVSAVERGVLRAIGIAVPA